MSRQITPVSKARFWIGMVLTIIPSLMLIFSAVMKLLAPPQVLTEVTRLGYPQSHTIKLGVLELACTIVYIIPKTAVLGAILLTAYLGGATATHVRVGDPFIGPPILGILLWLGLYLRDSRLGELVPLRK